MDTIQSINHIATDPDVHGGRPYLLGTTVRVTDVMMGHIYDQKTPEQIAADYALSLSQVYAALAYYYLRQPELSEDLRRLILVAREAGTKRTGSDSQSQ